jgi:hypothetical protein
VHGQRAHAGKHRGLAGRRGDLEGIGLESGGVLDQARALGQQADHLVVDAVDAGAHGGQVGG